MSQKYRLQPKQHLPSRLIAALKYAIAAAAGAVLTLLAILAWNTVDLTDSLAVQPTGLTAAVPQDATEITVWNIQALREGPYLEVYSETPTVEDFMQDQMVYLQRSEAADPYEFDQYLKFHKDGWSAVELATGRIDFPYMEFVLDDDGYSNGNYRGYDLWTKDVVYAMVPDEGYLIGSQDETSAEGFLNHFHRIDDLPETDRELPLPILIEHVGEGSVITAQQGFNNCPVRRCQGLAVATEGYDWAEDELSIKFTLLFRNEESAEDAAWDYDAVASHLEQKFSLEVIDLTNDGRFITGTATGGRDFLSRLK